jgi:hypothetical protein
VLEPLLKFSWGRTEGPSEFGEVAAAEEQQHDGGNDQHVRPEDLSGDGSAERR